MSDTQQFAAALTFANRRALANAYGLVIAGEDNDGAGKAKPVGPSTKRTGTNTRQLATDLWKLLPPSVAGKNQNWGAAKQFLMDENIITPEEHGGNVHALDVSPERYAEIINAVKEKATGL
jgi:hypothetical protein